MWLTPPDKPSGEEIMVYGVSRDSRYFSNISDTPIPSDNEVLVSQGYIEKYGIEVGGTVRLREKYGGKSYSFKVKEAVNYPASLAVFMNDELFRDTFGKDGDYFTGYLSDRRLADIKDEYVASVITEHDLVIVADPLDDSMGLVFPIMGGFAILLYMLMIYMLSKLILEKNAQSISITKILGYSGREIGKLYVDITSDFSTRENNGRQNNRQRERNTLSLRKRNAGTNPGFQSLHDFSGADDIAESSDYDRGADCRNSACP